jgi:hypothetical protein
MHTEVLYPYNVLSCMKEACFLEPTKLSIQRKLTYMNFNR